MEQMRDKVEEEGRTWSRQEAKLRKKEGERMRDKVEEEETRRSR